ADDVLLLSTSPEGLQSKLNCLAAWCLRNGLAVNVTKSYPMAFGPLPCSLPRITLNGMPLRLTESTPYVGVTLSSTKRNIFAVHRASQAKKGWRVACASLGLEVYIGPIPPLFARKLYNARVHPHLISGCVVDLDVNITDLHALEKVQHVFARRVSRLPEHTHILPVLMDLGMRPVRYSRMLAALVMLEGLVTTAPAVPKAALACSVSLVAHGHISWAGDLYHALRALPVPVDWDFRTPPTLDRVRDVRNQVLASLLQSALLCISGTTKLALWKWGVLPTIARTPSLDVLFKLRLYTTIARISHRHAVACLLAGVPPFAVELMRYHQVPRERRICRFCRVRSAVEDESHILFSCPNNALAAERDTFHTRVLALRPRTLEARRRLTDWRFLAMALLDDELLATAAEYIHAAFEACKGTPVYEILTDEDWAAVPERVD
ncbi:hypothetical protein TRAPUB_2318, partial [Trametes pubescens]